MNFVLQPWQLILLILAGWMNREQQQRIDYLETQFAVLMEHIGNKRILLTDAPLSSSGLRSHYATLI